MELKDAINRYISFNVDTTWPSSKWCLKIQEYLALNFPELLEDYKNERKKSRDANMFCSQIEKLVKAKGHCSCNGGRWKAVK